VNVVIVDELEVVDVEDDQREYAPVTLAAFELV
jgi:hypothetical protein